MALSEEHKSKLLKIESHLKEHPFPPQIIIETTSRCNFRCLHCAHKTMKRKKADMSSKLFKKIIDEIAEKSPGTEIWPAFYGEPLLLGKKLFNFLRYAQKKGCNNIFLNTNGSLLKHQWIRDEILSSGIKSLIVSLDAFSKETFETIRRGGNRDEIYKSVESFINDKRKRKRRYPVVICQFVIMTENKHEVDSFLQYWFKKGADVKIRNIGTWTGAIHAPQLDYDDDFRIACPIGNNTLAIHQNGNVVACCADYEGGFIAGNIKEKTIEEIWLTTLYERIRKPFREHRWDDIPDVCKSCRDWQICGAEYYSYKEDNKDVYPFWYAKAERT